MKSPPIGGTSNGRSAFTLAQKVNIDYQPYHVRQWVILTRFIENHRQHIFILTFYTLLVIGAFFQKAYGKMKIWWVGGKWWWWWWWRKSYPLYPLFSFHRIRSVKRILRPTTCSRLWCECESWSCRSNDYHFLNIVTNNESKHFDLFTRNSSDELDSFRFSHCIS